MKNYVIIIDLKSMIDLFTTLCFLSMFCTCLFIVCMLIATATKKKMTLKCWMGVCHVVLRLCSLSEET